MAESAFWSSFLRPLGEVKQYVLPSEEEESESISDDKDSIYTMSEDGSDPDQKEWSRPYTRKSAAHQSEAHQEFPGVPVGQSKHGANQQQDNSRHRESASKWTVDDLNNYIKREKINLVTRLCQPELSYQDNPPDFKKDLINCSKQILDKAKQFSEAPANGLKLWKLRSWDLNEATISILVQRVLGPVCQSVDVIMKPELTLQKKDPFGAAKVDFALFYERFCVGVVEIKTPKTLGPDSVAQLLLPLMKLQLKNEDSKVAYLGILTDGFRYVFVKHQGDEFIFEKTESVDGPSINIHELRTWADFHRLQIDLCTMLKDIPTH